LRPFFSSQTLARKAMLFNDLREPPPVPIMYRFHLWVISIIEFSGIYEALPDFQVPSSHVYKFSCEGSV
jgi:hypothetical protein